MTTGADGVMHAHSLETDVCIVGAGPAGLTIAQKLEGSSSRVLVLESGRRQVVAEAQRPNRGESVGYPMFRLHISRSRAFGGTSNLWEGYDGWNARPLDAIDFVERQGVPYSGWPFDRAHLDPYYERAHAICGLGPYNYEPEEWAEDDRTPLLKLSGATVENTMFQRGEATTFTRTFDRFQRSRNVDVMLNARAHEIRTDGSRRVTSVLVRRDDGSEFVVRPKLLVLAAGGIENPRLLLLADSMRGLGNEHDLVGRFFAERLSARTGEIIDATPDFAELVEFYEVHQVQGGRAQGALRVADDVQWERGLLNCVFFPLVRPDVITNEAARSAATLRKALRRQPMVDQPMAHVGNIAKGLRDVVAHARARFVVGDKAVIIRAQQEQAPNPESRVMLGSRRDEYGQPVARVDWRPTAFDHDSMVQSQHLVDEALQQSGIGRLVHVIGGERPQLLFEGNYHHLGSTRMHREPTQGVVNADSRIHGSPNVYVAGSSVFPTYGSSNPTLTIVAMAVRLADHLKQQFRG